MLDDAAPCRTDSRKTPASESAKKAKATLELAPGEPAYNGKPLHRTTRQEIEGARGIYSGRPTSDNPEWASGRVLCVHP
jgi:hypothetical protein